MATTQEGWLILFFAFLFMGTILFGVGGIIKAYQRYRFEKWFEKEIGFMRSQ